MNATREVDNRCRFTEDGFAAAYAFDALDGEECLAFEAHRRGCPTCAEEAAAFTALLAELPLAVDETIVGARAPTLRGRVPTSVHNGGSDSYESADPPPERQPIAAPGRPPSPTGNDDDRSPVLSQITTVAPDRPTGRSRRWRRIAQIPLVAAFLALVVGLSLLTRVVAPEGTPPGVPSSTARVALVLGSSSAPAARGEAVSLQGRGQIRLVVYNLPPLAPGKVYQAWVLRAGRPQSVGAFSVPNGTGEVILPGDLTANDALLVTIEPAPAGSALPSTAPVLSSLSVGGAAAATIVLPTATAGATATASPSPTPAPTATPVPTPTAPPSPIGEPAIAPPVVPPTVEATTVSAEPAQSPAPSPTAEPSPVDPPASPSTATLVPPLSLPTAAVAAQTPTGVRVATPAPTPAPIPTPVPWMPAPAPAPTPIPLSVPIPTAIAAPVSPSAPPVSEPAVAPDPTATQAPTAAPPTATAAPAPAPTAAPAPAPVPSPTLPSRPTPTPALPAVPAPARAVTPTVQPAPAPTLPPVPTRGLAPVPTPPLAPAPRPTSPPAPKPTLPPAPTPTLPPVPTPRLPVAPVPPTPTPPRRP